MIATSPNGRTIAGSHVTEGTRFVKADMPISIEMLSVTSFEKLLAGPEATTAFAVRLDDWQPPCTYESMFHIHQYNSNTYIMYLEGGRGDLLGIVGFGFDTEDCSVDVLELLGKCQLDQEFGGGVWGEGANCRVGSAAQHAENKG